MSVYVAPETPPPSRLPPKRRRWIGTAGVPWYRDQAIRRVIFQLIFLLVVFLFIYMAFRNLVNNLGDSGIVIDFDIFSRPFGTSVSEGPKIDTEIAWLANPNVASSPYWYLWSLFWIYLVFNYARRFEEKNRQRAILVVVGGLFLLIIQAVFLEWLFKELVPYLAPRANARVLVTGFVNTARVVLVSIIASTILGILAGIGLLSRNFLLRNISMAYVELFRNTPLYVQLLFVYTFLLSILPKAPDAILSPDQIKLPGLGTYTLYEKVFAFNTGGLNMINLKSTETTAVFWGAIVVGLIACWYLRQWRLEQQDLTGIPAHTWRLVLPLFLFFLVGGWLLAEGYPVGSGPFTVEYPVVSRFSVTGGYSVSIFFIALAVGLTLYTAAFIADIVRAGIQAVPYGQVEAARAHGLSNSQVLSLVVLPQALRLIVPPLGNQYVNLGKNSSLAIAVGFFDLYLLANVVNNESGQAVPIFMSLLVIYLILSLLLSFLTNIMNTVTQLRTR